MVHHLSGWDTKDNNDNMMTIPSQRTMLLLLLKKLKAEEELAGVRLVWLPVLMLNLPPCFTLPDCSHKVLMVMTKFRVVVFVVMSSVLSACRQLCLYETNIWVHTCMAQPASHPASLLTDWRTRCYFYLLIINLILNEFNFLFIPKRSSNSNNNNNTKKKSSQHTCLDVSTANRFENKSETTSYYGIMIRISQKTEKTKKL